MERLSRLLLTAQEDERRRVAREVHDELGQALTAVKIGLSHILSRATRRSSLESERRVATAAETLDRAIASVQRIVLRLRPGVLDNLGPLAALEHEVQQFRDQTGIAVQLELPEGHQVMLRANVVHVIDPSRAQAEGRESGFGVQFIELDAIRRAQIYQLVEYARWEGVAGGASLASRMLDIATSLPPGKVIDSLPAPGPSRPDPRRAPQPSVHAAANANDPRKTKPERPSSLSSSSASRATQPELPIAPADSQRPQGASLRSAQRTPLPGSVSAPPQAGSLRNAQKTPLPGSVSAPPVAPASTLAPGGGGPAPASASLPPSEPLDQEKLKVGMSHLAHKRFDQAIKVFEELARVSHAEAVAHVWLSLTHARIRLKQGDEPGAAEHYQKVLTHDAEHHEALKFVREFQAKKRLNSLPFGRYFVKK